MSFSISNTSASAVITKLSTPSSVTGELAVTDGSLPLVVGDLISGTNTEINDTKGSPFGSVLMFLQQGGAKIDTYVNNTLYSSDKYSSGLISVQTPILESSDSLTMSVSDPDFDCYSIGGFSGLANNVSTILEQPDGKILVSGVFNSYKGVNANRIIRLNADFSIDTSFNYGSGLKNFPALAIKLQDDGKILLGGNFSGYNETAINRIVRLNNDGSVDTSFNVGTGFNAIVRDIKILSDGKILVVGAFTSYSGDTTYPRIIRLLPTGEIDTTFASSSLSPNAGVVTQIGLQSDGKIILGGSFTQIRGTEIQSLIRLNADGNIDITFPTSGVTGTFPSDGINSLIVDEDDKIIIAGTFTSFSGIPLNRIARLNSDGTDDASFNIGSGFPPGSVNYLTLTNNKYLCSGNFSGYNDNLVSDMVRLNYDGSIDTTFNQGTGISRTAPAGLLVTSVLSNGNYLIMGPFSGYNDIPTENAIVVDPFGKLLNCEI
jgi:uncharacterized delta-60 repeat protein